MLSQGLFFSFLASSLATSQLGAGAQQCPLHTRAEAQPAPARHRSILHYPCRDHQWCGDREEHRGQARGDTWQGRHRPGHPSKTNTRFYPCQDQCCRLDTQGWGTSFCPGDHKGPACSSASPSRAPDLWQPTGTCASQELCNHYKTNRATDSSMWGS